MEQNTPIIAKKIWNLMRVAYFMLRKGICKRKILLDLKLCMKRGNIAGKALQNLMFHHHRHQNHQVSISSSKTGKDVSSQQLQCFSSPPPGEYEFSCSNTPSYHHFFSNKKKHQNNKNNNSSFFTPYSSFEDMDNNIEIVVDKMFDNMMRLSEKDNVMASPAVLGLGFGRNPGVRQLRITDSPFPVQNTEEDSKQVDAAAEDFIKKFYSQLKKQNYY